MVFNNLATSLLVPIVDVNRITMVKKKFQFRGRLNYFLKHLACMKSVLGTISIFCIPICCFSKHIQNRLQCPRSHMWHRGIRCQALATLIILFGLMKYWLVFAFVRNCLKRSIITGLCYTLWRIISLRF